MNQLYVYALSSRVWTRTDPLDSIIFRTIQGIGGAGGYALSTLVTYEMVPKSKLPLYGAINSVWVALATLIGPLFGGLINNDTTWRWVFYLK